MNENTDTEIRNEPETNNTEQRLEIVDVDRLVAEAEQRGYLRRCNEEAAARLNSPAMLENTSLRNHEKPADESDSFAARFLSRIQRGVWD